MKALALAAAALVTLGADVHAESYALPSGRLAEPSILPDVSVEIGGLKYGDGQSYGARVNYRYDALTILYADIGRVDVEGDDPPANDEGAGRLEVNGQTFGAGLFRHLPDFNESFDVSVRASYHQGGLDAKGFAQVSDGLFVRVKDEAKLVEYSADLLFSGREPIAENGLSWYGSLGYFNQEIGVEHVFESEGIPQIDTKASGVSFGGGVVLPLASGQAYIGYENRDGALFGAGFRYFLN